MLLAFLCAALPAPTAPTGIIDLGEEEESQFQTLRQDLSQRGKFAGIARETLRPEALIADSDRDAADVVLRRTCALLANLKQTGAADRLVALEERLAGLQQTCARTAPRTLMPAGPCSRRLCQVRREIAFANPLLDFDELSSQAPPGHLRAHVRPVLRHRPPREAASTCCAILSGLNPQVPGRVGELGRRSRTLERAEALRRSGSRALGFPMTERGNLSGEDGQGGSFLSPSLSYDGQTILFAYVECQGDKNHDGTPIPPAAIGPRAAAIISSRSTLTARGLGQLTDGTWNDFDPCWLPNGRVAFISERRGGYLRCGRVCPHYTLYDMAADGSDINCLSFHESNEWHPSVTHDGRIIYTRWDYVDRHGCIATCPGSPRWTAAIRAPCTATYAPRQNGRTWN